MRALAAAVTVVVLTAVWLVPVRLKLYLKYENDSVVSDFKIKYGFITVKKKQKSKKAKSEKNKNESRKKTSSSETVKFVKNNAADIKKLVRDSAEYAVRKCFRIDEFTLRAIVGTDDAMDTALVYGGASAFLYNILGALERKIIFKSIDIDFKPDFENEKIFIEFESIIKTKIYSAAVLALIVLRRIVPILKKRGEIYNGKSDKRTD